MDDISEDIKKLNDLLKTETETDDNDVVDLLNYDISDDEEEEEDEDVPDTFDDETSEKLQVISMSNDVPDTNLHLISNCISLSIGSNVLEVALTKEEYKTINSCQDEDLKKLLILNRVKNLQIMSKKRKLIDLLQMCNEMLRENSERVKTEQMQGKITSKSIIPKLGHPYIKTVRGYSNQHNPDVIKKRKFGEMSLDYLPRLCRWTLQDQVVLKRSIIYQYNTILITSLEKQLKLIQTEENSVKNKNAKIKEIERKIAERQNNVNEVQPPLDFDGIDWGSISKDDLYERHSPQACKAFWTMFLHPSINNSRWTGEEDTKLEILVRKHNFQNWEAIAEELNCNRSPLYVCLHYCCTFTPQYRRSRFDIEEDNTLLEIIDNCRIDSYIPWMKVANYFENRSRNQLYHRYRYRLKYKNIKKGCFSEAEDVLILILVSKFGTNFKKISDYMPIRLPIAIKYRYENYLTFATTARANWSIEEDELILEEVKKRGTKSWGKISSLLTHKTPLHVRQRYVTIHKWFSKNPNATMEDIPRRHVNFRKGLQLEIVHEVANKYKNASTLPTLEELEHELGKIPHKKTRHYVPVTTYNEEIDRDLILFFQSTYKIKTAKEISSQEMDKISNMIGNFFDLLGVNINYPNLQEIQTDTNLDVLDREILARLYDKSIACNQNVVPTVNLDPVCSTSTNKTKIVPAPVAGKKIASVNSHAPRLNLLIPPNLNSLIGLRSMFITYAAFKSAFPRLVRNRLQRSIQEDLEQFNTTIFDVIEKEREMFSKHFKMLFHWPALMSIVVPRDDLSILESPNVFVEEQVRTPVKKGRPKKNLVKVNRMNEIRMMRRLERLQQEAVERVSLDDLVEDETENNCNDGASSSEMSPTSESHADLDESSYEFISTTVKIEDSIVKLEQIPVETDIPYREMQTVDYTAQSGLENTTNIELNMFSDRKGKYDIETGDEIEIFSSIQPANSIQMRVDPIILKRKLTDRETDVNIKKIKCEDE